MTKQKIRIAWIDKGNFYFADVIDETWRGINAYKFSNDCIVNFHSTPIYIIT